jgi:translocation and assembly module TamB
VPGSGGRGPEDRTDVGIGRGVFRGFLDGIGAVLGILFVALGVAWVAAVVVTSTDWGHERIRRFVEGVAQRELNGQVRIGRVTGNMITGMTMHDIVIRDSAGKPFLAVESVQGDYGLLDLARKRVFISDAIIVRPLVMLDRPPDGTWNWKRILPHDTTRGPRVAKARWGDWVRFENARVIDGHVIVRTPWRPSRRLGSQAAQDSALRVALRGDSRPRIEKVAGGYQKIVELKSVTGVVPWFRFADPNYEDQLIRISAMTMEAYPFHPPAAEIRTLRGSFPFNDDSVWWKGAMARFPGSTVNGSGSYVFETGDMTLDARANPASTADLRWLYPRLPADGHGRLDLHMTWRGPVENYLATNMDLRMQGAHVTGSFGMERGDSVRFHDTNLRFAGVDTRLVEQLVVGFTSPRRGVLSGRAVIAGGRNALKVDADVSFADARGAGTSRVIALGEVGFPGRGVRARDLRLQLRPVQVELARTWAPKLPISGVVEGTAVVNGWTANALRIVANVQHRDAGTMSALSGTVAITELGSGRFDRMRFAADLQARPISLTEVGRFFPAVGLRSSATGAIHVNGTSSNLDIRTDLHLADGGRFVANGNVALDGTASRYDINAGLHTLNLNTVLEKAPQTSLTATAMVRGRGTELATMRTIIAADLQTSRWDSVAVDTASVRVTLADGLAQVSRLEARGYHTTASASGSFGLVAGRTGTLSYRVAVDSLGAFNRWIPGAGADTGVVPPRPGLVAAALRTARADSARIANRTDIERIVTGKAPPTLKVSLPRTVRRDTIGGTLYAAGTATGNITDFNLRGRLAGEELVFRGNYVQRLGAEFAWSDVRTPGARAVVALDADSVMALGFAIDSMGVRLSYANNAGHAEVLLRQGATRDYLLASDFSLAPDRKEARIANLRARIDTALWTAPHPSVIRWGGPGIEVVNFELRNRGQGRIFANGLLPTEGTANFQLAISELPVQDVLDLLQSDLELRGGIALAGAMEGTLANPTFRGRYALTDGTYRGDSLPQMRGTFAYAAEVLETHMDLLRRGGAPMTTVDGRIPINLAFTGVTAPRMRDGSALVDVVADSLPLDLIPHFTDAVSDVTGFAGGRMTLRGKLKQPSLSGGLVIARGGFRLTATGQRVEGLSGTVRMQNDTVFLGDREVAGVPGSAGWIAGTSGDSIKARGTIAVGTWREPVFNLNVVAQNALLLDNEHGRIRADVAIAITGPLSGGFVSGGVTVRDGVFRAPDPTGRHVVSAGDPALFEVVDTSLVTDRELFPRRPAVLSNTSVDVDVQIHRNTWVRNRDANVEIFTDYPLRLIMSNSRLALTGVVTTDRGEYEFMSKRFQIRRGSALFIGDPDLNPTLQLTGEYEVKTASAAAIAIKVLIGGTLKRPTLALESDAQPPKSKAELLSLLAFGQASSSLLSIQGSSISAIGTGADLTGLAVRRLASVAMGVAVDELESEAQKNLGTDYFNITPADVPMELWLGRGFGNLVTQTSVEMGKYLNPRTFVGVRTVGVNLGASIQYRTPRGWLYEFSAQPRLLLVEPSLSEQVIRMRQAFGGFAIWERRY